MRRAAKDFAGVVKRHGQAKIDQLNAILADDEVLWLQVSVDDTNLLAFVYGLCSRIKRLSLQSLESMQHCLAKLLGSCRAAMWLVSARWVTQTREIGRMPAVESKEDMQCL